MNQALLRLVAGGYVGDWLKYEMHALTSGLESDLSGDTGLSMFDTSGPRMRYRGVDTRASTDFDGSDVGVAIDVERLNVRLSLPHADLTIGRQAVTFGTAYFWNPLDIFRPFDPTQFDRDYKSGVDAIRLDIPLGDYDMMTLVASLGKGTDENRWERSAVGRHTNDRLRNCLRRSAFYFDLTSHAAFGRKCAFGAMKSRRHADTGQCFRSN